MEKLQKLARKLARKQETSGGRQPLEHEYLGGMLKSEYLENAAARSGGGKAPSQQVRRTVNSAVWTQEAFCVPIHASTSRSVPGRNRREFTTALVKVGDISKTEVEFGRVPDVQRLYGVKRGVLYRKIRDGTIQSVSLREPGKKFGCRLVRLASVRAWLMSLMEEQQTIRPANEQADS
jgi:hypothetical protein